MDHVAIMTPSWKLIPKILTGEKAIESRWYRTRRAPGGKMKKGDRIFFKDSGKMVTVMAKVSKVWQFEIGSIKEAQDIVKKYGEKICLVNRDVKTWEKVPRYCMLMELEKPKLIEPFTVDKRGFGAGVAWMSVENIGQILL